MVPHTPFIWNNILTMVNKKSIFSRNDLSKLVIFATVFVSIRFLRQGIVFKPNSGNQVKNSLVSVVLHRLAKPIYGGRLFMMLNVLNASKCFHAWYFFFFSTRYKSRFTHCSSPSQHPPASGFPRQLHTHSILRWAHICSMRSKSHS